MRKDGGGLQEGTAAAVAGNAPGIREMQMKTMRYKIKSKRRTHIKCG